MYQQVPERIDLIDNNSGADFNQVQKNIEAVKGGNPANPPTFSLEELVTKLGAPDGIATLDLFGKILIDQIPLALLGVVSYKGTWDASLNEPPIPSASSSNKGWYFVVSVDGNFSIGGIDDWKAKDWLVSNGSQWEKIDNTEKLNPDDLEYLANKGAPDGYASLDSNGRLLISQMPTDAGDMKKADYDSENDGIIEKAKDSYVLAVNNNPYPVLKGTSVNLVVVGGNLQFMEAKSSDISRMPAHGILSEDVGPGSVGKILRFGTLTELDTSAFPSGTYLYVGDTAPLYLTSIKPVFPNIAQYIGRIILSDPLNGSILVSPEPAQGFSGTNFCAGNDFRLSDNRFPLAHTHPAAEISDATPSGLALLTDTPAAGRSALGVDAAGDPRPPSIGSLIEETSPSFLDFFPVRNSLSSTEKKVLAERLLPFTSYRKWWSIGDDLTTTTCFGLGTNVSGSGAANSSGITPVGRIGMVSSSTGTTATGRAGFISGASAFRLGQGLCRCAIGVRIPTASDGTETFSVRFGFIDSGTAESTDGVFYRYVYSVNSGNWQAVAKNNGVESVLNTSLSTNVWRDFRIEISPDGLSAEFISGGASLGIISTNIPIAAGRETGFGAVIIKSLGVTARTMQLDYLIAWGELLTERIL